MKETYILDAWALLAFLQGEEPAAGHVKELLEDALAQNTKLLVSSINLGEVYYRVGKTRSQDEAEKILSDVRRLPVEIISATDERVFEAARLKMMHSISYADAFAAAVTLEFNAILLTGDPELLLLEEQVRIEKLHRNTSN